MPLTVSQSVTLPLFSLLHSVIGSDFHFFRWSCHSLPALVSLGAMARRCRLAGVVSDARRVAPGRLSIARSWLELLLVGCLLALSDLLSSTETCARLGFPFRSRLCSIYSFLLLLDIEQDGWMDGWNQRPSR